MQAAGKGLKILTRLRRALSRFRRDRSGVGAIEFAIIVPVLLLLYLGAVETTVGLSVAKRASRATGAVADIVTQQQSVTKSTLAAMPYAAASIFAPFGTTGLTLKITGITLDSAGNATVAWSWAQDGSKPYTVGAAVTTVPTDMATPSSFLVRAELSIPYQLMSFGPDFLPSGTNQITIKRQYFYRPRQSATLACSDC